MSAGHSVCILAAVSVDAEASGNGFADKFQHEVAAYRLDRMLGLNVVPVSVLRNLDGEMGSVQAYVEDAVDQQSATAYELGFFEQDWVKFTAEKTAG